MWLQEIKFTVSCYVPHLPINGEENQGHTARTNRKGQKSAFVQHLNGKCRGSSNAIGEKLILLLGALRLVKESE